MDSNTQTPQPEEKQSIWSKLFGGKKEDVAVPAAPVSSEPTATSTFSSMQVTDVTPPSPSEPATSFGAPAAPTIEESTLPPINNAAPSFSSDTVAPETTNLSSPVDQVPQDDVNRVDEALSALPPLPITPDVPPEVPITDEAPQPPVDPMVNPVTPPSEGEVPAEDQGPADPLQP